MTARDGDGRPLAQKSRLGQPVSEETVATYTAAQGFLVGEWVGALVMVASFTQLYVAVFGRAYSGRTALVVGAALLALGGWMFWKSHAYYKRLDFPWRRRWDAVAVVVAGSAVIFWLLFLVLAVLVWRDYPILPD
ncbi:MAG TPA: hypothetical protein VI796_07040 [Candidatus Thermoplasmatota archaeon]|nr:hypothetical protein [Candidatus Thermoplasmatota archaeon]